MRAPGDDVVTIELARCGFHPTVLARRPGADHALRGLLAREGAIAHA